jgi:hypothetical protein
MNNMDFIINNNIIISALSGITGALIGTFLSILYSKSQAKNNLTFEILRTFNSSEFLIVLRIIGEIKKKWNSGDKNIVYYFISNTDRAIESVLINKLTEHQNLTLYLRFINQVEYYYRNNLIDRKTFFNLFIATQYVWNIEFLTEFVEEYFKAKDIYSPDSPVPTWIKAIEGLNLIYNKNICIPFQSQNGCS